MAVIRRRVSATIEGDFVVFLIGARINSPWKFAQIAWFLPLMGRMIRELQARPESGFLGVEPMGLTSMVQYWRSLDQLMTYARAKDNEHFPAWVEFNKRIGSNGDIGIWHETYCIRAGEYECVYNNMPPYGLAKASEMRDAVGRHQTARGRLGQTDGSDDPSQSSQG
jgi:hypothetical protein